MNSFKGSVPPSPSLAHAWALTTTSVRPTRPESDRLRLMSPQISKNVQALAATRPRPPMLLLVLEVANRLSENGCVDQDHDLQGPDSPIVVAVLCVGLGATSAHPSNFENSSVPVYAAKPIRRCLGRVHDDRCRCSPRGFPGGSL